MPIYEDFAYFYDYLMRDVDYDGWFDYIQQILKLNDFMPESVLELACGTGNMSIRMAKMGLDVTAVDMSADMLNIAEQKAVQNGVDIRFIQQDITQLEVHKPFDLILCLCDSINYILEHEKIEQLFRRVKESLDNNGIFIFDINSRYKLKDIIGCNTFAESYQQVSYIWENYYDQLNHQSEFYLTFFINKGEHYIRKEETHYQRAYTIDQILESLHKAGFDDVDTYEAFGFENPTECSERINFVVKNQKTVI